MTGWDVYGGPASVSAGMLAELAALRAGHLYCRAFGRTEFELFGTGPPGIITTPPATTRRPQPASGPAR